MNNKTSIFKIICTITLLITHMHLVAASSSPSPFAENFIYQGTIGTGLTITQSEYYVLAEDISYSTAAGTAITIDADNIVLNMDSRVIALSSGANTWDNIEVT